MVRTKRTVCVQRTRILLAIPLLTFASTLQATNRPEGIKASQLANQMLEATGVTGGLVVHLGCGDGRVTAALRVNERFLVHGLDEDPANVDKAREYLHGRDLYGPVTVECLRESALPYADNLVNLLIVSDARGRVSREEILRVLAPDGAALVPVGSDEKSEPGSQASTAQFVMIEGRKWAKIRKPRPAGIDQWTHWLHGPDGNPVARDTVVGPPRRMQWFATPVWSRSHEKSPSLTGMVSAKGRIFYISDEGPLSIGGRLPDKWRLVARDGFNGTLLWKLPVPDWGWKAWSPEQPMNLRWGNPRFIHRRLVAAEDRVYVTLGYNAPVTAFDAATGKTIRVYQGTENTSEILYHEGLLVLSAATEPKTAVDNAPPLKVMAIDADSGKQLWETGPYPSLYDLGERGKANVLKQGRLMIAIGGDHVYGVTEREILALDLPDGKLAWSTPRPPAELPDGGSKRVQIAANKMFTNLGSIMYHEGRVFFTQPHVPTSKLVNNVRMTLVCLSAETGEERWRRVCGDWSYTTNLNVYAARGLIWVHADPTKGRYDLLGLEPGTGKITVKFDLASVLDTRHHHRCYRNRATENFLLMGKEGVEYINLDSGAVLPHRWLRGMCLYGIMPANGLLYVPPQACSCNPMTMLQGYWSLAPTSSHSKVPDASVAERLEKGPVYAAAIERATVSAEDWPMYHHDALRSGATQSAVNAQLQECWRTAIGGKLTGPVVSGGKVYLGCRDTHELVALDAREGTVLWRYRTGGAMDSPPTCHQGMILAGCSDGWVYCLRASDGSLIWRYQAAPQARYVVADDRIQSAWPVHGSVMIQNNLAYVTAGRSSFLDSGIRFYMLQPETGKVLKTRTLYTEQTDQNAFYEGVTSDLLTSDGDALFMRHLHVNPATLELTRLSWWGFTGPQPKGRDKPYAEHHGLPVSRTPYTYLRSGQGFLDDSYFGRTQYHLDGGEACHLMCFNKERSYGFQMSTGTGHFVFFTPGDKGYSILCFDRTRETRRKDRKLWEQKEPLRVHAMVLAGDNLFAGGVPDVIDPDDPFAYFDGKKGGRLVAFDASTGKKLSELQLDASPVTGGLIAADRKLYLTDRAGHILCLTGR